MRVKDTPYSEVTGPFCRVPWQGLSRAPKHILLVYLCRIAVRTPGNTSPNRLFLGSVASVPSPWVSPRLPIPFYVRLLSGATRLARDIQHPGRPSLLRHRFGSSASPGGAGILTGCPSPTPFGLSLGSPNPGRTNLPQETLDFRRADFSSAFSLLIPGFSLLLRPALLTVRLHPNAARYPTTLRLATKNPRLR